MVMSSAEIIRIISCTLEVLFLFCSMACSARFFSCFSERSSSLACWSFLHRQQGGVADQTLDSFQLFYSV